MNINKKNSLVLKFFMLASFTVLLNAQQTVDIAKVQSFTVQKYKANFNAQTGKSKNDILNDYVQTMKLSDAILKTDLKNDVDYEIANRLLTVNIWAKKIMRDAKVSNKKLKKLFKKHVPKIEARYKLRNILLNSKTESNQTYKKLKKITRKSKRSKEFSKLVQSKSEDFTTRKNDGLIGWIDKNKLNPDMKKALSGKKSNDIVKVYVKDIGWQILLVEDFKAEKKANFEDSKAILTQLAKEEILSKKIEEILKK